MAKDQFYELFVCELKDIFNAENQLVSAIPQFIENATDEKLKDALNRQLQDTKQHLTRLNTIFSQLHENSAGETYPAMEGLIKDGTSLLEKYTVSAIRDAAIITVLQRISHYEMAVYGTLRTYAKQLEYHEISDLLQQCLNEEGSMNKTLTEIAKGGFFTSGINQRALDS